MTSPTSRGGARSNLPLDLTVRPVTSVANCATGARVCFAAYGRALSVAGLPSETDTYIEGSPA
jgi:hypothetical protein